MNQFWRYGMKYGKPKKTVFSTGFNYGDLENEINRLQIEHQSAENKHKLAQEKLGIGNSWLGQSGIRRHLARCPKATED
jgi:hypothetical protein